MDDLTHASFFSGVGGLDLGLERAGWRTVSFSEIDPYASAVLAERWPGVPNLGSIVDIARASDGHPGEPRAPRLQQPEGRRGGHADWHDATLWSGGFPCQDLSVAGKRRGMGAGTRSGLAFAFLDLVERYRPPAIILENVPGLLSSNHGRDFYALQRRLAELGYVGAYRVLDARHFGVPQRRRRVFIVALDARRGATADDAAEVLSVGSRCRRHPPTGIEAGEGAADGTRPGVDIARTVVGTAGKRHDEDTDTLVPVGASPDPGRVRAPDGLAGRPHDRGGVVNALDQRRGGADDNEAQAGHLVAHYRKSTRAQSVEHDETWVPDDLTNTLNGFDVGDARAVELIAGGGSVSDDALLPLGLDSHRYRCCGNGVVADVAEWIGYRLRVSIEGPVVPLPATDTP